MGPKIDKKWNEIHRGNSMITKKYFLLFCRNKFYKANILSLPGRSLFEGAGGDLSWPGTSSNQGSIWTSSPFSTSNSTLPERSSKLDVRMHNLTFDNSNLEWRVRLFCRRKLLRSIGNDLLLWFSIWTRLLLRQHSTNSSKRKTNWTLVFANEAARGCCRCSQIGLISEPLWPSISRHPCPPALQFVVVFRIIILQGWNLNIRSLKTSLNFKVFRK